MRMTFFTAATLITVLTLAACGGIDRVSADAKLQSACEAGIRALYDPTDHLEVKKTTFASAKSTADDDLRLVNMTALYTKHGGFIEQKEYKCAFVEQIGFNDYSARFYHLDLAGIKYGTFKGQMEGNYSDILKIQQAMDKYLTSDAG